MFVPAHFRYGEAQHALACEGKMAPGSVDGDAEDLSWVSLKLGKDRISECHLLAADWILVRRIEGEDDRVVEEFVERCAGLACAAGRTRRYEEDTTTVRRTILLNKISGFASHAFTGADVPHWSYVRGAAWQMEHVSAAL
jgi:hypothetical protein